MPSENVFPFLN